MFKKIISLMMAMLILSTTAMGAYAEKNTGGEIIRFVGGGDSPSGGWKYSRTLTITISSSEMKRMYDDLFAAKRGNTSSIDDAMGTIASIANIKNLPVISVILAFIRDIDDVISESYDVVNHALNRDPNSKLYEIQIKEYVRELTNEKVISVVQAFGK